MSDEYQPTTKPSRLERFKLFYEAVPAPDYLKPAKPDGSAKKTIIRSKFRDRRISRRRK